MHNTINRLSLSTSLLIGLLMSHALCAGGQPRAIAFEDGEHFDMTLSRINYNRVYVDGEIITKLRYTKGTFVVEKGDPQKPDILEDSVYLKPVFDAPLTVFFTTDKKHHFSLTIKSDESAGKTLRLLAKNQTTLKYVKRDTNDVSDVDAAMSAMKSGEAPKDFSSKHVVSRPFYVKKDIKVSLEKQYQGAHSSGYVYRIENKSNHDVALSTALFSHKKAEVLSLSDDTLAPKKVAYLYGLYSNDA